MKCPKCREKMEFNHSFEMDDRLIQVYVCQKCKFKDCDDIRVITPPPKGKEGLEKERR